MGPWAVASPAFQVLGRALCLHPTPHGGHQVAVRDEQRLPHRPAWMRWSTEGEKPGALSTAEPSSFWLLVLFALFGPILFLATPFFRNIDCLVFLCHLCTGRPAGSLRTF